MGIYIHNIKNRHGEIDVQGENPFDKFHINREGRIVYFSEFIPTYYWKKDDGYHNLRYWIEAAVTRMGY